jgi:NAD(P)H-flavin reductase
VVSTLHFTLATRVGHRYTKTDNVVACWGHWSKLNCYLIPSLVIWFIDRGARIARMILLHYNYLPDGSMGFQAANALMTHFPDSVNGDVVRLDFVHSCDPWLVGQHFYLCFPALSIWQSHPFTPSSLPGTKAEGSVHSYVVRAKKGATKALAELAASDTRLGLEKTSRRRPANTPVVLAGPYGSSTTNKLTPDTNILCVAGGTGVTFVLPVLLNLANQVSVQDRKVKLIWAVRREADMNWVHDELDHLRRATYMDIRVYVTQESQSPANTGDSDQVAVRTTRFRDKEMCASSASASSSVGGTPKNETAPPALLVSKSNHHELRRPDLRGIVREFLESAVTGPTAVFASGPGEMISDLRSIVAGCNDAVKVWKGQDRYNVRLVCDDRLEW